MKKSQNTRKSMNLYFKTTHETPKRKALYLKTEKYDLKNKNKNDMKKI